MSQARSPSWGTALIVAVAAGIGLVAGLGLGSDDDAPAAGERATDPAPLLFVQAASQGRVTRARSELRLSLKASRWTQSFTDRPRRTAGVERTTRFVTRWPGRGFRSDPPNAALAIDSEGGDAYALELRRPRYAHGWLHYSIRPLKSSRTPRAGRFGTASLFVDESGVIDACTAEHPCAAIQNGQ